MKHCNKCGRDLPEDSFAKDKNKKDGLCAWCRDCMFEYSKKKRPNAVQLGRRKSPPSNDFLKSLYEGDGRTIESIAKEYGISYAAIYRRLKSSGALIRKSSESRAISEKLGRIEPQKGKKLSPELREKCLKALEKARRGRVKKHRYISRGYVEIFIGDGKWRFEHDIIAEKVLGRPLADNECVHHINHIKDDNRIENLRVMDKREHAIMHQRELIESGSHHRLKLTKQQALQIKRSKEPCKKLAEKFGVTKNAIYSIRNGRTWKEL